MADSGAGSGWEWSDATVSGTEFNDATLVFEELLELNVSDDRLVPLLVVPDGTEAIFRFSAERDMAGSGPGFGAGFDMADSGTDPSPDPHRRAMPPTGAWLIRVRVNSGVCPEASDPALIFC